MKRQNQIKRVLAKPESLETVRQMLADGVAPTRSALAVAVCERFGFLNPFGLTQASGCAKALRELERDGHFTLQAPQRQGAGKTHEARCLDVPVPSPCDVPGRAEDVRGLRLVMVDSADKLLVWNRMMKDEHPQGAGPLVGRQLRYLVESEHGCLGGFGFASAARHLTGRDHWIGWDSGVRTELLHRVVGMARFLIRPGVRCHNLASRLMGMVLRVVGGDFNARYGYSPWLVESFVDTEAFTGTCYRAANWVSVGETKGRGRQDRFNKAGKTVKEIYVYPLAQDWRARMGVAEPAGPAALDPAEGLGGDEWAANEFGAAALGDKRLTDLLVECAQAQGADPGRSFSSVAQGDRAMRKAYYKLIDKPDDSKEVCPESILAAHCERTKLRMMAHDTVLTISDGTKLNFSGLTKCTGLGVIGGNQTGAQSKGLHLHTTMAITADGLPLGLLDAQFTAPAPKTPPPPDASPANGEAKQGKEKGKGKAKEGEKGKVGPATPVPIEEKQTFAWIKSMRVCTEAARGMPGTRVIEMCDREADFYELFEEQSRAKGVHLLVRAQYDRCTDEDDLKLFEATRQSPVAGHVAITVKRQSQREKKSKQKASVKVLERKANLELHYRKFTMRPSGQHKGKDDITLWVVHARETDPPEGVDPVEWFLLTTLPVETLGEAEQCLRWYCLRWRIEDWHRVLKSGCRVESLQHKTAERLKRAVAVNMVIAWRIMLMTLLGRECPDLSADVLFSDVEIEVLEEWAKKKT